MDLQIKFVIDPAVDLPLVEAAATRITRRPIRVPAGQITLPQIGMPR
ncbi:hypothetical protein [Methylobacterium sp. ARG-1]|nr:hypothetical protein [Methylobacterium sp. ARG-1]